MKVLVACEFSGTVRDAFAKMGHDAWSCDLIPCDKPGNHIQGDVLSILGQGWDMMIAHPPCTYLTISAEWAYKDPDYDRYPGVGYHQKVKPGTLVGEERRQARREAIAFVKSLRDSGVPKVAIENPVGVLSSAWRKPNQVIQPWQFGHDASKATCLWLIGLPALKPTKEIQPRYICCGTQMDVDSVGVRGCANCNGSKRARPRWGNQTDGGQNKLAPSADRWALRSLTYQGIADAMASQWGGEALPYSCATLFAA